MTQDLHQVLRAALIKGVVTYLKTFGHLYPYVSRIEHLAEGEELDFVSHSSVHGISWKIVVSNPNSEHPLDDMLFIPLDPMLLKTTYLLLLWRELNKLQKDDIYRISACHLLRGVQNARDMLWIDANVEKLCVFDVRVKEDLRGNMSEYEWYLSRLQSLLEVYIEETLIK